MGASEARNGRRGLVLWFAHLIVPAALLAIFVLAWMGGASENAAALRVVGAVGALWLAVGLALPLGRAGRERSARLGTKLFLSTAVLLLLLLGIELALRVQAFGSPFLPERAESRPNADQHPTRGWSYAPGTEWVSQGAEFRVPIRLNSRGLRDVEHELEPAPGVFRIVVLGDSFMEAFQIALEESLPRRLEAGLAARRVEVVNLGVRGYGTPQEFLYLEEEGLAYQPDLVVLSLFIGNDLHNNHRALEERVWVEPGPHSEQRPYARIDPESGALSWIPPDGASLARSRALDRTQRYLGFLRKLQLLRGLRSHERRPYDLNVAYGAYARTFDPELKLSNFDAEWYQREFDESWRLTIGMFVELRERLAKSGTELVVLGVPIWFAVDAEFMKGMFKGGMELDAELPSERLAAAAEAHALHVLDLTPLFREALERGEGPFYFPRDRHWNPEGHRFAAEALIEFLEEEGLVPVAGG